MKVTLSAIKADIGSIGGHIKPSKKILETVENFVREEGLKKGLIIDFYIGYTGDDIALLFTHENGVGNEEVHELSWNAFMAGAEVAKQQGLYGAGQDLLKDAFSGNVRGLGPGIAEMEIEERPNEAFVVFAADKTEPGAFNLPLYLAFADPMYNSGLILSPHMAKGFTFTVMDVEHVECDRVIELHVPEDLYNLAALLRDNGRYVVAKITSRKSGEQAVAASTTRLRNIAGKYVGKDDPIMIVRVQKEFPATGEMLSAFSIGHYVAGFMRGSHNGPLMPVKLNTPTSFFDGPPIVSGAAFCVKEGKLTEPADVFDHPFWEWMRNIISWKAFEIRRQGFSGPAMLPYHDLEYGGIVERLKEVKDRFYDRK